MKADFLARPLGLVQVCVLFCFFFPKSLSLSIFFLENSKTVVVVLFCLFLFLTFWNCRSKERKTQ